MFIVVKMNAIVSVIEQSVIISRVVLLNVIILKAIMLITIAGHYVECR
jgi:hypothetical protein